MTPNFRLGATLIAASAVLSAASVNRSYGKLPLHFEENRGQNASAGLYIAKAPGALMSIGRDGMSIARPGSQVSMRFLGANPRARVAGESRQEGVSHYYLGLRQILDVPHYERVRIKAVRPGVDVLYYATGKESELEYDVILSPGVNPAAARFRFDGAQAARTNEQGDLIIQAAGGELRSHAPVAWQDLPSGRRSVECRYQLAQSGEVQFVLGRHDPAYAVTIDPVLSYSTFLGGAISPDYITKIAVDTVGSAYVTGFTLSNDFPLTNGARGGDLDVFVTKLSPNGNSIVYSTIFGGTWEDRGTAIAVDSAGNAWVTGLANKDNFPVTMGSAPTSPDAFVAKITPAGTIALLRVFGGTSSDEGYGIALDRSGNIFIAGSTDRAGFPVTAGAYRTTPAGSTEAFVAKLSGQGEILAATYIGGTAMDIAAGIVVNPTNGDVAVTGYTFSSDFPVTAAAVQSALGGQSDAFLTILNSSLNSLGYSTYLGGSSEESGAAVAADSAGSYYVTGWTKSSDFPVTAGSLNVTKGIGPDAFVTKISPAGTVVYATFLGDNNDDYASDIAVDQAGNAVIVGQTASLGFPTTPGALKTMKNTWGSDLFLSRLNPAGSALTYSTYLGSSENDAGVGVALDALGTAYVAGQTYSLYFPTTPGAYQVSNPKAGSFNYGPVAFISKIDLTSPVLCNAVLNPPSATMPARGGSVSFTLTLPAGCPWEALSDVGITLTGTARGIGGATPVPFTVVVGQNDSTSSPRTLNVQFGTGTFAVRQDAASCLDPVLAPTSLSYDASGGIRSLGITLPSSCNWAVVATVPWLTVTLGRFGAGTGSATIYATQNSFGPRSTTLNLLGKQVPVTQAAGSCTASVAAPMTNFPAAGGAGSVKIAVSGNSCAWNAYNLASWIHINGSSAAGQGSQTVAFSVDGNPTPLVRTGQLQLGDQTVNVMQAAAPPGTIVTYTSTVFAGRPDTSGSVGDGGPAFPATLDSPKELAFDSAGTLYLTEKYRIRAITPDGIIYTVAGGGTGTGENVPATSVSIYPTDLAVDSNAIYFNDGWNRVRKVSGGIVTTFAGTGIGLDGADGGNAISTPIGKVSGLTTDSADNVFIGDATYHKVRKVSGGTITTFAGGASNFADKVAPTATTLSPAELATGPDGALYIFDEWTGRIRKASAVITTVAGGGMSPLDVVPATEAAIQPGGMTFDSSNALVLADNHRIRRLEPGGTLRTLFTAVDPVFGIAADSSGDIFYTGYYLIHKLTPISTQCTFSVGTPALQPASGGSLTLNITVEVGCAWTAASDLPWASINGTFSGIGPGSVTVTLAANPAPAARTGNVIVAGQVVAITQSGSVSRNRRDVRGTGHSDVVVYDPIAGWEYTGLTNGDGTFNFTSALYTPGFTHLRFGDFNGDGKADLVVYNVNNALAYIGTGDGSGRFNFQSLFWSPGFSSVIPCDLDGDGRTDFILYRPSDGTLFTAISNGNGTFRYAYNLISSAYTHLKVGDFNGDGRSDLFVHQLDARAFIGLSNGSGTFSFNSVTGAGTLNDFAEVGDIDGDGSDDVLVYSSYSGVARIAWSGSGAFTTSYGWSPGFTTVRLFDYNGDGKADIALHNKVNTLGYMGLSTGSNGFNFSSLFWGPAMDRLDVTDLNGDGKPDVILYYSTTGTVYTGLNTGVTASPFNYRYLYWGIGRMFAE